MPKYANFLKDLLTNRKNMEEESKVVLNENCSVTMLNKLPQKMGDPGSLTLPCPFGNLVTCYALVDSEISVNLMPYSFFKKLNHPEPRLIRMAIHLAKKTVTFPRGICEDILVKVDKFVFPADFIVLDMEEDHQVSIVIGRPFLSTACAIVAIRECKLTLRHSKFSDDTAFSIDSLEKLLEGWKEDKSSKSTFASEDDFDAERDLNEIERQLEEREYDELTRNVENSTRQVSEINSASWDEKSRSDGKTGHNSMSSITGLNVFSVQNMKLELNTLLEHLEYAFLEEGDQKHVIIASDLTQTEKEELVNVLKKRKNAIALNITDIKGVSPSLLFS
ncbi:uncharacterized protein LOC111894678 [Lactuca sativa]|uniref:uncharacterized protein LOC111894678 n=1 Tax=Lactuca sativa TaxID=4236 RepID=UPI000CD9C1D9|nr:uncharacterized protein LOC111894678 [Lactuca sativa]